MSQALPRSPCQVEFNRSLPVPSLRHAIRAINYGFHQSLAIEGRLTAPGQTRSGLLVAGAFLPPPAASRRVRGLGQRPKVLILWVQGDHLPGLHGMPVGDACNGELPGDWKGEAAPFGVAIGIVTRMG